MPVDECIHFHIIIDASSVCLICMYSLGSLPTFLYNLVPRALFFFPQNLKMYKHEYIGANYLYIRTNLTFLHLLSFQ